MTVEVDVVADLDGGATAPPTQRRSKGRVVWVVLVPALVSAVVGEVLLSRASGREDT